MSKFTDDLMTDLTNCSDSLDIVWEKLEAVKEFAHCWRQGQNVTWQELLEILDGS